jgi:hypothetical protein
VGAVLASNAPYFLNQTGMESDKLVLLMQVGCVVSFISSFFNPATIIKFSQRTLILSGISLCAAIYFATGVAACLPKSNKAPLAIGLSLQCTSLVFGPTVGSGYCIAGEVSTIRLRAKSQGIAFAWQGIVSTIWTIVLP